MKTPAIALECSQCGATDFHPAGEKRIRCAYCGSLFELLSPEPKLTIMPGANVVFGKNANVEIRGDVEIRQGARVDIQGKVVMVKGEQRRAVGLKWIPPEK